jgi:hypothetical protein
MNTMKLKGKELVEWRRQYVAQGMLAHKTVRQIQAELEKLATEGVGERCGTGTVGRDVQAVRAAWVETRKKAIEEVVAEDLARLKEMERRWWAKANSDDQGAGEAAERVLAIMRQRAALLGLGSSGGRGAVQVTAGAMAGSVGGVNTEGPLPAGAQVKVLVEYVDDRRDL